MRKSRAILTLVLAFMVIVSAACGSVEDEAGASSGRPCAEIQSDLDAATADSTDQAGTPDEASASDRVDDLEAELDDCDSAEPTSTDVETLDGEIISLPVVDGGDPANPISGTQSNNDPRTPAVRGSGDQKAIVGSWKELNEVRGEDAAYTECAETRLGMGFDWAEDVPKFIETEEAHHGTRFLLAVNTTATDEQLLMKAREDVPDLPDDVAIVRVAGIVNTRGFNSGRCEAFWDARSMVRVSLGVVVYDDDGEPIGLDTDPKGTRGRGAFVDCHNPWELVRKVVVPPRTTPTTQPPRRETTTTRPGDTTTTTRPGDTTTTTRPGDTTTTTVCSSGKCTPPTTRPAPPTTAAPPATTPTTLGDNDSGDGAYNTIPPGSVPTTVAPPATTPPTSSPPTTRVNF